MEHLYKKINVEWKVSNVDLWEIRFLRNRYFDIVLLIDK